MKTTLAPILCLATFGLLGHPEAAHAYLDPGTGSIIIQSILAAVAGALVAGRLYWERIKAFFRGSASEESKAEDPAEK